VKKLKKEEKIAEIIANDRCFTVSETTKYRYFVCRGISNNLYDIIYFKGFGRWKCNCNNIRKTDCYHIETAKQVKEIEDSIEKNK